MCTVCHRKNATKPTTFLSTSAVSDSSFSSSVADNAKNDPPYNYLSYSTLNSKLSVKTLQDLFILHLNIGSLVLNVDQIKSLISQTKVRPDVICLTESRLHDKKIEWQLQLVQIEGYFIPDLTYDNSPTNAGGVVIYFKDSLRKHIKHKPELRLDVPDCESVFFELVSPKKPQGENQRK